MIECDDARDMLATSRRPTHARQRVPVAVEHIRVPHVTHAREVLALCSQAVGPSADIEATADEVAAGELRVK